MTHTQLCPAPPNDPSRVPRMARVQETKPEFDGVQPVGMVGGTHTYAGLQRSLATSLTNCLHAKHAAEKILGIEHNHPQRSARLLSDLLERCARQRDTALQNGGCVRRAALGHRLHVRHLGQARAAGDCEQPSLLPPISARVKVLLGPPTVSFSPNVSPGALGRTALSSAVMCVEPRQRAVRVAGLSTRKRTGGFRPQPAAYAHDDILLRGSARTFYSPVPIARQTTC